MCVKIYFLAAIRWWPFLCTFAPHTIKTNYDKVMLYATSSSVLDQFRVVVVGFASAIAAFLAPISFSIFTLITLFGVNTLIGYFADLATGGKWNKSKMWRAVIDILILYGAIFFIYGLGVLMKNQEGALQCVSWLSYAVIWFFSVNINRNAITIAPEGGQAQGVLKLTYWVISVEFIKRIPFLASYFESKSTSTATQS